VSLWLEHQAWEITRIKKETNMNLRCSFCQTPFTIGRIEKLDALQHLDANNLTHYDAHCPRCRRSTPVLRQKLEMSMPNWREALKELEAEMKANPLPEAPLPKPEAEYAAQAESRPEHRHHRTRAGKAKVEEKPAPKSKKAPKKSAAKEADKEPKTKTSKTTTPKAKAPAKKAK